MKKTDIRKRLAHTSISITIQIRKRLAHTSISITIQYLQEVTRGK